MEHAPGLTYVYAARYSCCKFLLHNESPLIVYELYLSSAPFSGEFYKRAVVQDKFAIDKIQNVCNAI